MNRIAVICLLLVTPATVISTSATDKTSINKNWVSPIRILTSFSDFKDLFNPLPAQPALVMACGLPQSSVRQQTCHKLSEMLANLSTEYPNTSVQVMSIELNEADSEFFTHLRYRSDPQFMYIRDGRIYSYTKQTVSNLQLVQFVAYFNENPDFMYRRLPEKPLGLASNMIEGLYAILDKTQVIFGRIRPALYFVYCIFACLALMMLYAIWSIIDELITGKRYAHLANQLKQSSASKNGNAQTSEDLKVKRD